MDGKELRIGNIINWQVGHSVMQGNVTSISTESIVIDHKTTFKTRSESDSYRLIPIPLTEEWLLKFGFNYLHDEHEMYDSNIHKIYRKNINIAVKDKFYLWINIEDDTYYSFKWTEIQFVHQLQNLYYALIGKELRLDNDPNVT